MSDIPEGFDDPAASVGGPLSQPPAPEAQQTPPEDAEGPRTHHARATVRPTEGLVDAAGTVTPPDPDGTQDYDEPEEPEPPREPEPPKSFPDEHQQSFEGLMYLGRLVEHVDVYGHDIVIQTLTMEQMMVAGLIHKKYRQTLGDTRAWQAAVLAGSIQTVDGKALPIPVEDVNTETLMRDRFNYIIKHWFPPTVDALYTAFLELEGEVEEVLKALGEASG